MHPAPSVIVFSVLSGMGFGLLLFLGTGAPAIFGLQAFAGYALGYGLAAGGLLAAGFHLANPRNAPKAFREWRSSWLSREAWAAVIALTLMAGPALAQIFFDRLWPALGYLAGGMGLLTVFCTGMIYAQLKTVPRWFQPWTPVLFLCLSVAGGAILAGYRWSALAFLLLSLVAQLAHWRHADRSERPDASLSLGNATGLGHLGTLRLLEAPHSGENYLLREMAYQIGRKHALKLRWIALIAGYALPAMILVISGHWFASACAVVSHSAGILASRWLFFAEARHVMALYYDR